MVYLMLPYLSLKTFDCFTTAFGDLPLFDTIEGHFTLIESFNMNRLIVGKRETSLIFEHRYGRMTYNGWINYDNPLSCHKEP